LNRIGSWADTFGAPRQPLHRFKNDFVSNLVSEINVGQPKPNTEDISRSKRKRKRVVILDDGDQEDQDSDFELKVSKKKQKNSKKTNVLTTKRRLSNRQVEKSQHKIKAETKNETSQQNVQIKEEIDDMVSFSYF
jgi:hypothetical protein